MSGVFYRYWGISAIRSWTRQLTKIINYTKIIKMTKAYKSRNA